MGRKADRAGLTRRDLLRRAAAGATATLGAAAGVDKGLDALFAAQTDSRGMRYRILGRTKLKVSEISFGTSRTASAAVIHRGLDLGLNFLDTAATYRNGNCEVEVGKALKGRRDGVAVATKWVARGGASSVDSFRLRGATSAADLLKSLDDSLRRLGMDHVDIIDNHRAEDEDLVNSDVVWDAFTTARKAGKVRFSGLSTHVNQAAVIRAAVKSGRYDTVLVSHNALTADTVGPALVEARKADVGVIIMKALQPVHESKGLDAFRDLRGNPYQRAIQWVLRDPNVSTLIVDMPNLEELEQDVAAATAKVGEAQLREFELALATAAAGACRLCGACTGQCPAGVKVADIMRYMLYHDGYGDRGRAVELYRELPASATAAACGDCPGCKAICPWGLPVQARMHRAHAILA